MDRCARLFMAQRAQRSAEEATACRQLLDAAARELGRLDGWGLTSFIRLAAAVKYLPAAYLESWQGHMLQHMQELTPQVSAWCGVVPLCTCTCRSLCMNS